MAWNRFIAVVLACFASLIVLASNAIAQSSTGGFRDSDIHDASRCGCVGRGETELSCDGHSDCNCRAAGCRGKACTTARDMWDREPAAGDQSQHYSYDTVRMYYYRRPYNAAHVRDSRMQGTSRDYALSGGFPADPGATERHRRDIFARVNRQIAADLSQPIEGGYLEYIDWQEHRQAKEKWQQQVQTEDQPDEASERAAERWPQQQPLR